MIHPNYVENIKSFEGFAPQSTWDYAQNTNGYGTRALYPGEVIDRAEAEKRFRAEIAQAQAIVEKFAPGLDEGSKAALTSLTYNAGTAWTESGLGDAIKRGDLDAARSIFLNYNKAGGETLSGLTARRLAEVTWFGQPPSSCALPQGASGGSDGVAAMPGTTRHDGPAGASVPTQTASAERGGAQEQPFNDINSSPTTRDTGPTIGPRRYQPSSDDILALLSLLSPSPAVMPTERDDERKDNKAPVDSSPPSTSA